MAILRDKIVWNYTMSDPTNNSFLNRSRLRDLVLLLCFVSALIYRFNTFNVIAGFFLLATGSFLHMVAKGILIRNVVLSNKGIYGIVRHPYYLANYLVDISFCILSSNLYLLLVYPFLFFWAYGPTLRKEEEYLATQHGDSFINYGFETPQILPDGASLKKWRNIFEGFSLKRISIKEYSRVARFLSVGFAIVLVHELKDEGLEGLKHLLLPTKHDYDEFVFLMIVIVLFVFSVILMRITHGYRETRN